MEIGRKQLNHEWTDGEVYFLTICCAPRGLNQLAKVDVWNGISETLDLREGKGELISKVTLAMPDHLHGLWAFPHGGMAKIVADMKRWWAVKYDLRWQRDFFDHRLRGWESAQEKRRYIEMNPVRAGLVKTKEQWEFVRWR